MYIQYTFCYLILFLIDKNVWGILGNQEFTNLVIKIIFKKLYCACFKTYHCVFLQCVVTLCRQHTVNFNGSNWTLKLSVFSASILTSSCLFCSASDPDPDESEFFADPSLKIPYLDQFVLLIIYFKSINENYTKLESIFA